MVSRTLTGGGKNPCLSGGLPGQKKLFSFTFFASAAGCHGRSGCCGCENNESEAVKLRSAFGYRTGLALLKARQPPCPARPFSRTTQLSSLFREGASRATIGRRGCRRCGFRRGERDISPCPLGVKATGPLHTFLLPERRKALSVGESFVNNLWIASPNSSCAPESIQIRPCCRCFNAPVVRDHRDHPLGPRRPEPWRSDARRCPSSPGFPTTCAGSVPPLAWLSLLSVRHQQSPSIAAKTLRLDSVGESGCSWLRCVLDRWLGLRLATVWILARAVG